jgi:uncharacterized FlaG/YvyC family protein
MSQVTATSVDSLLAPTAPRAPAARRSEAAPRPETPAPAVAGPEAPLDDRLLQEAVDEINAVLRDSEAETHEVGLAYRDDTDEPVVEVRDRESGELLAQFPPETIIHMRQQMREFLGMMLDSMS